MSNLKIILLCSNRFAIPVIREMAFFNLLAVVAIPRQNEEMIENVEQVLTGFDIAIIELDKETFSQQLLEAMEDNEVNMGIVNTFPYKIPSSIYTVPEKGFYNIHPGPLPAYRGTDPVFQQIKNQEKYAGVSIHKMDEGIDTGPVVICEMLKIAKTDTYGLLSTKLANLAAKLTGMLVRLADMGMEIPARMQDENKASHFPKQGAQDICINWQTMDADTIMALIQACNPWNKGAVTKINYQVIRLLEAKKIKADPAIIHEPGTIISLDENGMNVAVINKEVLAVSVIYAEEGFLHASRLLELGILPGQLFEME